MPERETRQEAAERELLAVREEVRRLAENMRARLVDEDSARATHAETAGLERPVGDAPAEVGQEAEELEVRRVAWQPEREPGPGRLPDDSAGSGRF